MNVGDMVMVRNSCRTHHMRCNNRIGQVDYIDITLIYPIGVRIEGVVNKNTGSGCFYFKEDDLLAIGGETKKKEDSTMFKCDPLTIKNVYFNDPVTVVMWNDGTKTIVRCSENDFYDPEKGLAMAIVKKAYGNDNKFHKVFKKWIPEEDEAQKGANLRSSDLSAHFSMLFRSCTVCKHRGQPANMDPCLTCRLGLTGFMHPCFEPADSED